MRDVIVIGGCPAGMIAAGKASSLGCKVTLFEKNNRVGKKLAISGKGRCNITNECTFDELMENIPGNSRFLYSSFNKFDNYDTIDFFKNKGVELKTERGGRVFPVSDNAEDVVIALKRYCTDNGVIFKYNSPVKKVLVDSEMVKGVEFINGQKAYADAVIIATGGASYKATGSSGDGYKMAEELGHNIIPIRPSLVPICVKEDYVKDLQGLSLKNIEVILRDNKSNEIHRDFGELLFTHFGLSGPVILTLSRKIIDNKDCNICIDLKPALSEEALEKRIQRDFDKYINKSFKNSLDELLPQKLIPVVIMLSGISPDKKVNQITKEERMSLNKLIKRLSFSITGTRPLNEAIITVGGIDIKEINPKTMQSKLIDGLYFAGEIIDCDVYTGCYNLTIAFSTGYTAGESAAQ